MKKIIFIVLISLTLVSCESVYDYTIKVVYDNGQQETLEFNRKGGFLILDDGGLRFGISLEYNSAEIHGVRRFEILKKTKSKESN
ncbi:MAG: hypothetical protein ACI9AT_000431 [Ulvibacter sp.]|jgi:hypothetical protein